MTDPLAPRFQKQSKTMAKRMLMFQKERFGLDEEWKPIQGYFDYEISDRGRVANRKLYNILKGSLNFDGYLKVSLRNEEGLKAHSIHRLVAKAFIPTDDFSLQINHIDGVKTNNNVTNLEWVTAQENFDHAFRTGLRPHYVIRGTNYVYIPETDETFISQLHLHEEKGWALKRIMRAVKTGELIEGVHIQRMKF